MNNYYGPTPEWSCAMIRGMDNYEMPDRIENDGSIECDDPWNVRR